jgi:hypothetical protein
MFYRAPLCKTCGVKSGLGSCPKCDATREELARVEQEMKQHMGAVKAKAKESANVR